jgi:CubicO group peptidase (beta-lactamase class C family)
MSPAAEVGMSTERLSRIDDHLKRRYVDVGKIPGALTLVYRRGEIAHFSPVGSMDLERGTAMREDTIFRIYSMTKPVTSVAMMMLYEQGHFQLDDPVDRWIPEWRNLRVYEAGNHPVFATRPCERRMTIRDLMTHTSGLTYGFMERTNVDAAYRKLEIGGGDRTLREMMVALADLPLEFSPGTAWNYSVSTDVLGHLVAEISGQPFDAYLREHIFEPLGMVDTGFRVPEADVDRFAACYERNRRKELRLQDDPQASPYLKARKFLSGGGGLVSTAADYLHFCQMLHDGGEFDGARLLGRKTIELMTRNHLPGGEDLASFAQGAFSETPYDGVGFGLGFSVTLDPARAQVVGSPGEYAWGGAASTAFWIDPAEDLIVLFFTQFMPSRTFNFRGQLKSIIYGAIVD